MSSSTSSARQPHLLILELLCALNHIIHVLAYCHPPFFSLFFACLSSCFLFCLLFSGSAKWKENLLAQAAASYRNRSQAVINLQRLVYEGI